MSRKPTQNGRGGRRGKKEDEMSSFIRSQLKRLDMELAKCSRNQDDGAGTSGTSKVQTVQEKERPEPPPPPRPERQWVEKSTDIRIIKPANSGNFGYVYAHSGFMKDHFSKVLRRVCVKELTWKECGRLPAAAYEQEDYYFDAHVVLKPSQNHCDPTDLLLCSVMDLTEDMRGMLHDQVHLELLELEKIFNERNTDDSKIPLDGLAMGNRINPGVFLIRGDYFPESDSKIPKRPKDYWDKKEAEESEEEYCYSSDDSDYEGRERHEKYLKQKAMWKEELRNRGICPRTREEEPLLSYITFEHDKKVMTAMFGVRLAKKEKGRPDFAGYKLQIAYRDIKTIVMDCSENLDHVYMELSSIPVLYEAMEQSSEKINMEEFSEWVRTLGWAGDAEGKGVGCSRDAFWQSPCIRLTFDRNHPARILTLPYLVQVFTRIKTQSKAKLVFGPIFAQRRKLAPTPDFQTLGSFRADYALNALYTRGSVFSDQLFDAADAKNLPSEPLKPVDLDKEPLFLQIVRKSLEDAREIAEEALEQLIRIIDEKRKIEILETFVTCFEQSLKEYEEALRTGETDLKIFNTIPKNCMMVRKIIVTPSRVILMPPDMMMENRVLRRFGADNALRCVFRDDNMKKLHLREYSRRGTDGMPNFATEPITRAFLQGFQISDRLYHFLGWSNSQMRDQGCYFFAPVKTADGRVTGTIEEIRNVMGNFDKVNTVSKMMSRMGQCFTQAQPTIMLSKKHYVVEEDIMGGIQNQYCFTDGCGRISQKLATKIASILELEYVPCVFQIRFKGFKGIVVIDPTIDTIINMPKIIFRKSQEKFEVSSDARDALEVVKYSMPSEMCLNRPLLTVLDHVSENQSFESHQRIKKRVHYYLDREFSALSNMLITEKHAAQELTERVPLPVNWTSVRICGMQITTDPFLKAMLSTIYKYNVMNHISKAKLLLPPSMGRSMYGVVDETGLLQTGQVFIQYSKSMQYNPNEKPIRHLGKVMITKNPCLVPGDVRMFDAVWQPSLAHLVDVVVFPKHGPRPHPDEMAGSDLDGDEYSVILDPELYLDRNERAMIYPNTKNQKVDTDAKPSLQGMLDVFLNYMSQDAIGKVSTAHLVAADVYGLFSEQCKSIAQKCAVAVDFPKSGVPAEPLTREESTPTNPDYMPSAVKPIYYSTRLNGEIYRKGQKVQELLDHQQLQETSEGSLGSLEPLGPAENYDYVLCPQGYSPEEFEKAKAFLVLEEYARKVQYLMDEYGIESEPALVSGHPTTIRRLAAMEKDDYSFYHTDKIVQLRYEEIIKEFRARFFEDFGGEEANSDRFGTLTISDKMGEKMRIWYYVAYGNLKRKNGRVVGRSLPWVVWEVLVDVRRKLMLDSNAFHMVLQHPIALKLSNALQGSIDDHLEQLELFKEEIENDRDALFLRKYSNVYGPNLTKIVFLLNQWLEKEAVLPSPCLTIWHVARLLIRFALGEATDHAHVDYEKGSLAPTIKFSKWCSKNLDLEEKLNLDMADSGTLVLEFLRFLASQTFAGAELQKLRVFDDKGIIEPILYREEQWTPLHKIAYRTFHLIAATGRFTSLRLTDETLTEHISESSAPLLVLAKLDGRNYNGTYVSRKMIVDALKEWSGCQSIHFRAKPQNNPYNDPVEYVTCVGSALARQKLEKILFLDEETIIDAVFTRTVPPEIEQF